MNIVKYPDVRLSQPASSFSIINKQFHQDIQRSVEILQATKNAAALAANQIGSIHNFFTYYLADNTIKTIINPIILNKSNPYLVKEGCLSFTGELIIPRYRDISVSYLDFNTMETVNNRVVVDFEAEVFQHEVEHLSGRNFSDNLTDPVRQQRFLLRQRH